MEALYKLLHAIFYIGFDVNALLYCNVPFKVDLFFCCRCFFFLDTWPVVLKSHSRVQQPFIILQKSIFLV